MKDIHEKFSRLGVKIPSIMMPSKGVDLHKWAVVACDQYTSEPDYWQSLEEEIGDAPSTLHLVFPEVYLEEEDKNQRIQKINTTMEKYLSSGILEEHSPSFFLVRRKTPHSPARWGLIAALDLEAYDYSKGSRSLIRATEGTILDRIPPRKQIRIHAPIELPHIIVLIDDVDKKVLEPLAAKAEDFEKIYDFDLMKNGGHVTAYKIADEDVLDSIAEALTELADSSRFLKKYGKEEVLLFAMGDGNHSLATAKSVWEDIKASAPGDPGIMNHPARWALVEIENIYDEGLVFEPIHRVIFDTDFGEFSALLTTQGEVHFEKLSSVREIMARVEAPSDEQVLGYVDAERTGVFIVRGADATIPAGTVQSVIDRLLVSGDATVDYIHGAEATENLGRKKGNVGIFLPSLDKADFFKTVIHDGALPRKTFSMGEANEKRYYIESRKIR
jgi:hypothetical protein